MNNSLIKAQNTCINPNSNPVKTLALQFVMGIETMKQH